MEENSFEQFEVDEVNMFKNTNRQNKIWSNNMSGRQFLSSVKNSNIPLSQTQGTRKCSDSGMWNSVPPGENPDIRGN